MKTNTNMPATFMPDEQDPLTLSDFDAFIPELTNRFSDIPQLNSKPSPWSQPFHSPPQQTSNEPVQSTRYTLTNAPNPNNLQTFILTKNSDST